MDISAIKYWRKDIEGLRFFAIVPVILFHYNPILMQNGFLGVDVFFLISGHLTSKQFYEHGYSNFSGFGEFIKRRIARIFPALGFWVVFFSILFSFYLIPSLHEPYYNTAIFSLLGVSNIYLFKEGLDYFSPNQNLNPFLHLWSISAEDQFYFTFSFTIIFLRFMSFPVIKSIYFLTFCSLIYFILNIRSYDSSSYCLTQFRFWEFMLGAVSYYSYSVRFKISAVCFNIIKLMCFILALFILISQIPINSIMLVLFCFLFIPLLYDRNSTNATSSFLSHPFFRYIGRISYSLYLIHFPMLKFMEYYYDLRSSIWVFLFFIVLLLTMSSLSYYFIEKRLAFYRDLPFVGTGLLITLCVLFTAISSTIPNSISASLENSVALSKSERVRSMTQKDDDDSNSVLILGDSHAQMFGSMYNTISITENIRFVDATGSACIFGFDVEYTDYNNRHINSCTTHMNKIISKLATTSYRAIIIASRLSAYFSPYLISLNDKSVSEINIGGQAYSVADYNALNA